MAKGKVVKNPKTGLWVAIKRVKGRPPTRIIGNFRSKREAERALRRKGKKAK